MHNFIMEVLRVRPPVAIPFPRLALKDFKVDNIHIEKGSQIILSYMSNHYDPVAYDNPKEFDMNRK